MSSEDLENTPALDLHHRAVRLAARRLDVGFLWTLAKSIPAAEASVGHMREAEADAISISALLDDLVRGEAEVAEALRPMYLEYLREHSGSHERRGSPPDDPPL
ncbi:MAG: hypothetical protein ACRDQ2_09755 [Gaiellales bacterium]